MRGVLLGLVLALTGCGVPHATGSAPGQDPIPVVPGQYLTVAARTPTHLHLWRFDARVIPVQPVRGELVPPSNPQVLGWWGRRAGARHGATLIVGHSVHTGGGELDSLPATPVGRVGVVSGIRYRVTRVRVVSKARLAAIAPRLFRQDGPPRLVVVSCADYDWPTGVWPDNAVVVARPVGAR